MSLHGSLNDERISRLTASSRSTPLIAEPADTVRSAIDKMQQHRVGYVLICEHGVLAGVFTERDLLKRVIAAGGDFDAPVSRFMTRDPKTLNMQDTVADAIKLMREGGYRHIPVVDEARRPLAVLSVKRIVHWLVEHYPTAVYNLPPTSTEVEPVREGA